VRVGERPGRRHVETVNLLNLEARGFNGSPGVAPGVAAATDAGPDPAPIREPLKPRLAGPGGSNVLEEPELAAWPDYAGQLGEDLPG
jgi:hypothetical protein